MLISKIVNDYLYFIFSCFSQKLRLINRNTGELLTLQDTLEYLLADDDEPLLNGSTVIMEYVDKNLSSVLPDLDKYPR